MRGMIVQRRMNTSVREVFVRRCTIGRVRGICPRRAYRVHAHERRLFPDCSSMCQPQPSFHKTGLRNGLPRFGLWPARPKLRPTGVSLERAELPPPPVSCGPFAEQGRAARVPLAPIDAWTLAALEAFRERALELAPRLALHDAALVLNSMARVRRTDRKLVRQGSAGIVGVLFVCDAALYMPPSGNSAERMGRSTAFSAVCQDLRCQAPPCMQTPGFRAASNSSGDVQGEPNCEIRGRPLDWLGTLEFVFHGGAEYITRELKAAPNLERSRPNLEAEVDQMWQRFDQISAGWRNSAYNRPD